MHLKKAGIYLRYQKEVNSISYLILMLLLGAMILDLSYHRIPNWYLLLVWPVGLVYRVTLEGFSGFYKGILLSFIPIIILYFLFQMKALGAGDIKLFAAIGVYLGYREMFVWIMASFVCGALIGSVILVRRRILIRQFIYFCNYMKEQMMLFPNQRIYQNARIGQDNVMHFTIAMVAGYCVILGKGF